MLETFKKYRFRLIGFIVSAGLTAHAIYIYGLAFYQGYMQELGFPIEFFPADTASIYIWAYTASRDLSASVLIPILSIGIWLFSIYIGLILFLIFYNYVVFRLNRSATHADDDKRSSDEKWDEKITASSGYKKKWLTFLYLLERAVATMQGPAMVFLTFLIIGLIWLVFPDLSIKQGQSLAERQRSAFSEQLCGKTDDYWSRCYIFFAEYLDYRQATVPDSNERFIEDLSPQEQRLIGRVIARNNEFMAIYTESGPVIITSPRQLFLKPVKNACYRKTDCDTTQQLSVL